MPLEIFKIFLILCGFALVYWGVKALELPKPMQVAITVLAGLLGLLFLWHIVNSGPIHQWLTA
jgi:hypothetical protein